MKRSQILSISVLVLLLLLVSTSAFIKWHFFSPPIQNTKFSLFEELNIQAKLAALGVSFNKENRRKHNFSLTPYYDSKDSRRVTFNRRELLFLVSKNSEFLKKFEINIDNDVVYVKARVFIDPNSIILPKKTMYIGGKLKIDKEKNRVKLSIDRKKFFFSDLFISEGLRLHEINFLDLFGLGEVGRPPMLNKLQKIEFRHNKVIVIVDKPKV